MAWGHGSTRSASKQRRTRSLSGVLSKMVGATCPEGLDGRSLTTTGDNAIALEERPQTEFDTLTLEKIAHLHFFFLH